VEIGEGTKINEQVFIGGLQFPDSRFIVGKNCLIMQSCYINPCRSIVIGDDSGVGVDCLLIGHASWANRFDGYPVDFEDIQIGSGVALAWRVTVLPGSRIGDGAVIGSNSLVKDRIPPRCLAVGNPARVVAQQPYFPRNPTAEEKQGYLHHIMAEFAEYLGGYGMTCKLEDPWLEFSTPRRSWFSSRPRLWRIRVAYSGAGEERTPLGEPGPDVFVSLHAIPRGIREAYDRLGVTWVDIERRERSDHGNDAGEEMIYYLKRYGVRATRVARAL
jgi:acetyltransferase-like isoleucine patch superfamily enzyme